MSEPAAAPSIAPGLFDLVVRYANDLADRGLSTRDPLKRDATIVVFCQTFFQQFFEYAFEYEITSIDQETKLEATRLRVEGKRDGASPEAIALVRSFEDLCDMWPDVLGFTYGGLSSEFRRFHTKYIPALLERIVRWAVVVGLTAIEVAAKAALATWEQTAKKWSKPTRS